MRHFLQHPRGVTMVELLIITVIIGILASAGVTSYRASHKYARFHNVVVAVMESIRTGRNLAINSRLIDNVTPEYYQVELTTAGSVISTKLQGKPEDASLKDLSQYNYTSPDGYYFDLVGDNTTTVSPPITLQFLPPFGDAVLSGTTATYVTLDFKIRPTAGNFCMNVNINKVSGLLSVDKSC